MLTDNEEQELREQSEDGRKAQVVQDFVSEFLATQRAITINKLETKEFNEAQDLVVPVLYLRTLRLFELELEKFISLGEIAEKRLNENDDD